MSPGEVYQLAQAKRSLLCVALDPAPEALPPSVWKGGLSQIERYLREVIDITSSQAIAYKLNTAFYEQWGEAGWGLLRRLRQALPSEALAIADAKRGDIAYTSKAYARAFFEDLSFDAITVHPYMGWEALQPFWSWGGKWVFVLLRTTECPPWQETIWPSIIRERPKDASATIGWVWGAHHAADMGFFRSLCPEDWLLVPGLGAQGGTLSEDSRWFPAFLVVGRAILAAPEETNSWVFRTAQFLPRS
ncbi:MAG: orotidine-5'-phosphate decarboxylase [Bacteroidia bacterium]|nr:orotidine-5'-phosphate decarboxylase [Bacteroidia bacterium]